MRRVTRWLGLGLASVVFASLSLAQQPVKPGPEHEALRKMEGTWDAVVNLGGMESKGTMTYKMELGGLWLTSHFEGGFGDQKFEGRGLDSYDAAKKKYVGVWADSMSTSPMVSEGQYDKEGKVLTMTGEGPGMDGKPAKFKMTTERNGKDTMVFTMYMADKDGKEQEAMSITYKRK